MDIEVILNKIPRHENDMMNNSTYMKILEEIDFWKMKVYCLL
jgi:hypothetical protein